MTTTTTPAIQSAEVEVLEAIAALTERAGSATYDRLIDRIDFRLQRETMSDATLDAWKALMGAVNKLHAAWSPCDECRGEGAIAKTCCTGSPARIECGCGGGPIADECPTCKGEGWQL